LWDKNNFVIQEVKVNQHATPRQKTNRIHGELSLLELNFNYM